MTAKHAIHHRLAVAIVLTLSTACTSDQPRALEWQLRFADSAIAAETSAVEVRILTGGCGGEELYFAQAPADALATVPAPPTLNPGPYGFEAIGRDADCRQLASGCVGVNLPEQAGVVVVELATIVMPTQECGVEQCIMGICERADGGAPPSCPLGRADCNANPADGCEVDLDETDNCGACGSVCRLPHAVATCDEAVCVIESCRDGFADCNTDAMDGCERALNTADSCGSGCATTECSFDHAQASCVSGRCEMGACHAGWADCDGDASNGCEQDLTSSTHCGTCAMACPVTTPLCDAETMRCVSACAIGTMNCGGTCTNLRHPNHCARCGNACDLDHAAAICGLGCQVGACDPGWGHCDVIESNGCETPLSRLDHCGACNNTCSATDALTTCHELTCQIEACVVPERDDCDDNVGNGCEADLRDAPHCGDCATECAAETPLCAEDVLGRYSCVDSCGSSTPDVCGQRCVDTQTDPENCGLCERLCTLPNTIALCGGGECAVARCEEGAADCDGVAATGCEVDLQSSTDHCGSCNRRCTAGPQQRVQCVDGECQTECEGGWGDCNGDDDDGCEEALTSITHCGACDDACEPVPNAASLECVAGACVAECVTDFGDCTSEPGCETSLGSDPDNCGGCGIRCRGMLGRCCAGTCCR